METGFVFSQEEVNEWYVLCFLCGRDHETGENDRSINGCETRERGLLIDVLEDGEYRMDEASLDWTH